MSGSQRTQVLKEGIKQKQALIPFPIFPGFSIEQRRASIEAYKRPTLQAVGDTHRGRGRSGHLASGLQDPEVDEPDLVEKGDARQCSQYISASQSIGSE